ncbi:hypothetical protein GN958_ATG14033 [Phytophthora infestans]|uniref:Uncharacterized protein n=1 Tax=Phytophthora infestans TaxID=4787 RepID=A0A8S9U8U6_PHYIN|nr:hypothetical protein GN958_ATG14033 [Phytophthora infestans]
MRPVEVVGTKDRSALQKMRWTLAVSMMRSPLLSRRYLRQEYNGGFGVAVEENIGFGKAKL